MALWMRYMRPIAWSIFPIPRRLTSLKSGIDAAVEIYKKMGLTTFLRNLLWGDQGYQEAYHFSGFTFPLLAGECAEAGFSDVKRIQEMPYNLGDCSALIDTILHIPISLNVEVKK